MRRMGSWYLRSWLNRSDGLVVGAAVLVWLAIVGRIGSRLGPVPLEMGDTADYLALAGHRPPLYGWLLAGYQALTGGLEHLPLLQLLLITTPLLVLAIELGRLLRSALAAVATLVLALLHAGIYDSIRLIQSEALFLATVMLGLALQCRYARLGGRGSLAGAAACFALATATRATGAAFLLLPLLAALLDRRLGLTAAACRAGMAAGAFGLVLLLVMAGNAVVQGRFGIGSWTGGSALGKGLLLVEPADLPNLPPAVAVVAPDAALLRQTIAAQPDLAARMRAQMQAAEDLRFAIFFPHAMATWPAWAAADGRGQSALGLDIWWRVVSRHPLEFLRLWARDWGSLLLLPMHWPAWATTEPQQRDVFAACHLHDNCWALTRYEVPRLSLVVMLLVSLAGGIGGAVLLLLGAGRVLRRRARPALALAWAAAAVVQLSLLATSAFESGLLRYTVALHILGLALLLGLATAGLRRLAARQAGVLLRVGRPVDGPMVGPGRPA